MIENKFEVNAATTRENDLTDVIGRLTCKACKHEFDVRTNIMMPENCKHALGHSLSVICPKCANIGTVTATEAKIYVLTKIREVIEEQRIRAKDVANVSKFTVDGKVDFNNHSANVKCDTCGDIFEVAAKNCPNFTVGVDTTVITCPKCGTKEETENNECTQFAGQLALRAMIENINDAISKLNKEAA